MAATMAVGGAATSQQERASDRQQRVMWRALAAVALMFIFIIALSVYFIVRYVNRDVDQALVEKAGVAYIAPLANLGAALGAHWQLAEKARIRGASAQDVAMVESDMNKAIAAIEALNAQETDLAVGDAWQGFMTKWKAVHAEAAAGHIPQAATYKNANLALQKFRLALKDHARLALDSGAESRYLIGSLTETMPALLDVLSKPVVLANGAESTVDYDALTGIEILSNPSVTAVLLEQLTTQLTIDMDHVFEIDPELKASIGRTYDSTQVTLSGMFQAAQNTADLGAEGKLARRSITQLSATISKQLDGILDARIHDLRHKRWIQLIASFVLLAVVLGLLWLAGHASARAARERDAQASKVQAEDQRNQAAILQLLNEMADLASGDLKVRAQVTENMTGALADSINFTIEELHRLVVQVNKAAGQVAEHVEQTRAISNDLFAASQKQREDITSTSAQVVQVTRSIRDVSSTAEESAEVARRSLAAAEKGTEAVGNSIQNMNDIRDRIQETSKQIKRLGESSQEIGEIVELISDITEQTNVLALNASIQAVSAGEAGRGFAIVAEEIQRLAERSGEATKQIGGLVRRIQHDTQEAVSSMEKSTQGVVEGAKLSDAAGDALNEIRGVSNQLADLIRKISDATQTQSGLAGQMLQNVQTILGVTEQTSKDTQRTNESIEYLAALANDLKQSVAGFKI